MKKKPYKRQKRFLILNLILACLVIGGVSAEYFLHFKKPYTQTMADASVKQKNAKETSDSGILMTDDSSGENAVDSLEKESSNSVQTAIPSMEPNGSMEPEESTDPAAHTGEVLDTRTLTLSMVGDVLLHTPVSKSGLQKNGTYNYDYLFKYIKKEVKASDVALLNEEVLLAGPSFGITGYPQFNGRFEVGDAIEKAGFDVVLHATNHSMDKGRAGLLSDLNHWKEAHPKLKITGMYRTKKEADRITYVKKHGIKIAILNYTYGTNGLPLPSDMPFAVNLMTEAKVKRDVKKAKKNADFVIVCPHWGTEYQDDIDSYQKKWTNLFLKLKVDLVLGAHPHVIEPVRWVSDKKGHRMLVYYSLGNYINSTARRGAGTFRQYLGGMADVTLEKTEDGKTSIKEAKFIPLITHYGQDRKITTYFFKDYSIKKAKKNRLSDQDPTFTMQKARKHFKNVIGQKFLTDI